MHSQFDSTLSFLKAELARRIRTNPRYSQRSFARDLGLGTGEVSEILSGRRKISVKTIQKISTAIGLSKIESEELFLKEFSSEPSKVQEHQIPEDQFRVIADWYCLAILNLAECRNFRWDPRHISSRLGITVTEASQAVERLERVGLIVRTKSGFKCVSDQVTAFTHVPSEAIREFHRQIIEKANAALESQKIEDREFQSLGLSIKKEDVSTIKREIDRFLTKLLTLFSNHDLKDEVYQIEVAAFRLTEPTKLNNSYRSKYEN